jgi:hypothetical protein
MEVLKEREKTSELQTCELEKWMNTALELLKDTWK